MKEKSQNKGSAFIHKKSGKILIASLSILLVLAAVVFGISYYYLSKINYTPVDQFGLESSVPSDETASSLDSSIPVESNSSDMQYGTGEVKSDPNIQNILLIGSDTRGGEKYGRSDSMLMISVDKSSKQIKMTSFLRDLYVKIDGIQDNRINVAYAYGGPKLLMDTIRNNFKIKIDNYIRVDFQSFQKIIDLAGGVTINLTQAEATELTVNASTYTEAGPLQSVHVGVNRLNGTTALAYARIRHIDSDFGRTQRQRNVLEALLAAVKGSGASTILKIADEFLPQVQTDLSVAQISSLALQSGEYLNNSMSQCTIPAQGAYQSKYIRDMAVLVPDIEENKEVLWKFIYNN
jgi:cell envelope-related function transcriptional attenuator common domain